MSDHSSHHLPEEAPLNIKREIQKYAAYWRWFVFSVVFFMIGAFLYLRYTPNTFQTSAKVKVLDDSKKQGINLEAALFRMQKVNLENEIEIIKSYRLMEPVVKDLNLTTSYFRTGNVVTKEIWNPFFKVTPLFKADTLPVVKVFSLRITPTGYLIKDGMDKVLADTQSFEITQPLPHVPFLIQLADTRNIRKEIGETYKVVFSPYSTTVKNLAARLNVTSVGKESEILQLSLNDGCTEKSEAILNTIIDQFNQDGIRDRQLVSQRTIDFVDDRFIYLSGELETIEKDKKNYKQDNQLSYIEADAGISIQKKAASEEELNRLETQVALSKILIETIGKDKGFTLLPGNIGLDNTSINASVAEYNKAVLERDKLISSAGINNPTVKILQSQLTDLQNNLANSVRTYQKQLAVSLQRLNALKQKATGVVSAMPEREKQLRAIERQQKIKENLYLLLLQKREEAAINLAVTAPSVKVVDYAITGGAPISPKRNIVLLGAFLLGLLVPFGIFYIRFLLNTTIQSKKEVELVAGEIPVLAEIPKIKGDNVIIETNDRSILAEAFRMLSSNLNYILPVTDDNKGKVVFVTSAVKNEGKTFMSLNLSLVLASLNHKVLLIGSDLRNPQLHVYIDTSKSVKGLSDYLHQPETNWKDCLSHKHFVQYHDVILSGMIPPNPSILLSNGRMAQLLDEAKKEYDYIIVDTAPTVLVSDTLMIGKYADATLLVTRINHTERELLEFSKKMSQENKLKNMAYVINNVGDGISDRYNYNYGYGYGYGVEAVEPSWFKKLLGKD
jgi:tyrosine-protein kinase Etk/Wzc